MRFLYYFFDDEKCLILAPILPQGQNFGLIFVIFFIFFLVHKMLTVPGFCGFPEKEFHGNSKRITEMRERPFSKSQRFTDGGVFLQLSSIEFFFHNYGLI